MKNSFYYLMPLLIITSLFYFNNIISKEKDKTKDTKMQTSLAISYTHFNINNISTWIYNDGRSDVSNSNAPGFIFPKGSHRALVYQSGLVWGGKVDNEKRVGGSVYRSGLEPGRILEDGTRQDPNSADARVFRVRPDYETANLDAEVADGDGPYDGAVREQYELDWNEWPAEHGAPYDDTNNNGQYDPDIDIPGVPGADQTLWFVANDFDPGATDYLYGSAPMGIEVQVTIWGYNTENTFGNVLFKKYKIINKNTEGKNFADMYLSIFADPDVGSSYDDYIGYDTELSLAYAYNAAAYDGQYEYYTPSVGFKVLQSPAAVNAFYFFLSANTLYADPRQGEYERGTLQFYNLMQGKISTTGEHFSRPTEVGGGTTSICMPGNPITKEGWIDGMVLPLTDRRMGLSCGPFAFNNQETKEIVFAVLAETHGVSYNTGQNHVGRIKTLAANLDTFYQTGMAVNIAGRSTIETNEETEYFLDLLSPDEDVTITSANWSITDQPAGSNPSILNSDIHGADFTTDLLGKYTLETNVTTSNSENITTSKIIYVGPLPSIASLLTPINNATDEPTNPLISWEPYQGALSYILHVSSDPDFSTLLINDEHFENTSQRISGLSVNTAYYWRLKIFSDRGAGDWSDVWSFTTGTTTDINNHIVTPTDYSLYQNFPNPFNPTTNIKYELPQSANVKFVVYNMLGEQVASLVNQFQNAGYHQVVFDGSNLKSGVYFYKIEAGSFMEVKKMVYLK